MECKNCKNGLPESVSYCELCGAKVIRNRITVRNLWDDVLETYINIDNSFLRTFLHLFARPAAVIDGYINGVRRRYMNPISYMGIALTLSGLTVLLMRNKITYADFEIFDQSMNPEFGEKVMNFTNDYYSLVFLLFLPVFAFAGWLTLNKQGYNLTEFLVVSIYALAQYSIFSFPISIALILWGSDHYMTYSLVSSVFMVSLFIYASQMISRYSIGAFFLRMFVFLMLLIIGYFALIFLIYAFMLVTGVIDINDLIPANQATSSAINWASYNLV